MQNHPIRNNKADRKRRDSNKEHHKQSSNLHHGYHYDTTDKNSLDKASGKDKRKLKARLDFTHTYVADVPKEVLAHVFSFLDPRSLADATLVCKAWYKLVDDDVAWKSAFKRFFDAEEFSPIGSGSWRTEYTLRSNLLRKWRRSRGPNISFDARVGPLDGIYVDFPSHRLLGASRRYGVLSLADPTTGKVARDLIYASSQRTTSEDVWSMDIGRFAIVYGYTTGHVALTTLARQASVRSFMNLTGGGEFHNGSVTTVWVEKDEAPKPGKIGAISGGADGMVRFWDITMGQLLRKDYVTANAIAAVKYDPRYKQWVVMDSTGVVFAAGGDLDASDDCFRRLAETEALEDYRGKLFLEIDWPANQAIVAHRQTARYDLSTGQKTQFSSGPIESAVKYCSLDPSAKYPVSDPMNVPGKGARFFATAHESNEVRVWNVRSKDDVVVPLHVIPFSSEIRSLSLTSMVVVIGGSDGVVLAFHTLDGTFLRVINSRFAGRARRLQEQQQYEAINNHYAASQIIIDSDPFSIRGAVAVGAHVRFFDFEPRGPDASPGRVKRKGLAKKRHTPLGLSTSPGGSRFLQEDIAVDVAQMAQDTKRHEEQNRQFARINGDMMADLTEAEMIEYVTMISADSQNANGDPEVEAAIRKSLARETEEDDDDEPSTSQAYSSHTGRHSLSLSPSPRQSPRWASSPPLHAHHPKTWEKVQSVSSSVGSTYEDDLDLAIRLSMAEQESLSTQQECEAGNFTLLM